MPEEKKFSLISVNAGDDDDIVIQAGAAPAASSRAASEPVDSAADRTAEPTTARGQAAPVEEPPSVAPSESAGRAEDAAGADDADGYQPTTLDDLKRSSMSTTQRVIVVIAALAIIAFVVRYVVM